MISQYFVHLISIVVHLFNIFVHLLCSIFCTCSIFLYTCLVCLYDHYVVVIFKSPWGSLPKQPPNNPQDVQFFNMFLIFRSNHLLPPASPFSTNFIFSHQHHLVPPTSSCPTYIILSHQHHLPPPSSSSPNSIIFSHLPSFFILIPIWKYFATWNGFGVSKSAGIQSSILEMIKQIAVYVGFHWRIH